MVDLRGPRSKRSVKGLIAASLLAMLAPAHGAQEGADLLHRDGFEDCITFNPPPGALFWDGGGDGTSWNDPLNWVGDAVPVDDDLVAIGGETRITVIYSIAAGTTRLAHLDSCQNLQITGGSLEVDGPGFARAILELTGGTLTASGPFLVGHTFMQDGNSTLNGDGTLTVANQFIWTDGNQQGNGETIINGTSTFDNATRILRSRTLTLNGATTWFGGQFNLWDGATINSNAPFDIQTDADMQHSTGATSTFNNNSTLTKSAGAALTDINANFANTGTISVVSGDLHMGRSTEANVSSGAFEVSNGSFFGIRGSHTMNGSSSFSGAGGVRMLVGGTTSIEGSYTVTGPLEVQGGTLGFAIPVSIEDDVTVSGGTLQFSQASSINANVMLSGSGTLEANADVPVSGNLDQIQNSSLDGTGIVTVAGNFLWSGGNQEGSGETIINGTSTIDNTTKILRARTLTFNGATAWAGGNINLFNAPTINNNDSFDIQSDADMQHSSGASATFNNNSSLTKSAGAALTDINANFANAGTISVLSGDLHMGRSTEANVSSGAFEVSNGSFFGIRGSHTMTAASSFSGAGGVRMVAGGTTSIEGSYTATGPLDGQGGTLSFAIPVSIEDDVTVSGGTIQITQASSINANVMLSGSGTLEANANVPVSGNFDQIQNSSLDGTGTVTVAGNFLWSDGNQEGSGETIITGTSTIDNTTKILRARTLTLNGATTWTGGNINLWNGATLNNNAPFDIQTDADMPHSSGAISTFNNDSSLTKSSGVDLTDINANFANTGTISVLSGDLHMGRSTEANMSSGAFEVSNGSFFGIRGSHTMTAASSFSGAGGVRMVAGGTTTIEGSYTASGPLDGQGGTLSFAIPVSIEDDVTVSGGTIEFTQASMINANVMLSGSGTLAANADVPVSGNLDQIQNSVVDGTGIVTVAGNFLWSDGNQEGSGETIITGTSTIDNTTKILRARTLTLNGATTWTGGNINLWNGATINNNASFDIQTDADMPHSSGAISTFNNNNSLTKSSGAADTSLAANFMNFGDVSVTSGELAFGRTFTQDGAGSINVNISGIGAFDSFAVSQGATLDGTLNITLIGGYMPVDMDMFEIMTFTARTGTFATVNGISIGNGNMFDVVYDANDVTLSVVPE